MYVGLRMLEILSNTNKKASELTEGITKYYNTPEIKVAVKDENKFEIIERVKSYVHDKGLESIEIDGIRINFEDGWALLRASNTGPNLTLRFEFTTEDRLNEVKEEYLNLVESLKGI